MSRAASSCKLMSVEETVEEFRNGRMVILADDEERGERGRSGHPGPDGNARGHQLHGALRPRADLPRARQRPGARPRPRADAQAQRVPPRYGVHRLHRGARGDHHRHLRLGPVAHHRGRHRPPLRAGRPDLAGSRLPPRRTRRRRAGADRAHRGERGPRPARRPQPVRRDLRDHERRRDHGADAGPRGLLPAPQRQDRDHRGPDRLPAAARQHHPQGAGDHAHLPPRRRIPHVRLRRHGAEGRAHRAGEGRRVGQRAGARAGPRLQHPR